MAFHDARHLRILCLTFLLLAYLTVADDSAVMAKLATSLSPIPSTWTSSNNFCDWDGITCDNSNRVTSINLPDKSLTGTLPSDLNQLSQLKTLTLPRNSISGDLPTLANLTFLQRITLDFNNFASIPLDFFTGLDNLHAFTISDNPGLSPWTIPSTLDQNTNLVTFQASNAGITGSIPEIFNKLNALQNLRLSYNNITGTLPRTFAGSLIQNLWLNNQQLSGTLDVISSMTQLNQVWLQANSFTGGIPDLSNCTGLFDLQLRDNQLTGLVPQSLVSLPKLINITLQNNMLQGPLPEFNSGVKNVIDRNSFCLPTPGPCDPQVTSLLDVAGAIGYPMSLAQSWQGNNVCHNWNFISCDSSGKNVTSVIFGKLRFSGFISPAFANLTSLRSLLLNDNNLVGSIPEVLTSLPNLQLLDVSNNNLSGPIPVFPPRVKFVHTGNLFLGRNVSGGPPGSGPGSSNTGGPTKGTTILVVGIVVGGLFVVVVGLFVFFKCYAMKKNENPGLGPGLVHDLERRKGKVKVNELTSVNQTEMSVFEGGNVLIPIQELRVATNNFSDENVLGKGGFGTVYRGILPNGDKIAVKRMDTGVMRTKALKEFEAEIAVLTTVRHKHLVALLGYCIDDNERLLVYEYMPQGTLSQHLINWRENKTNPLSWKQRVSIALDVGRGVEYLHGSTEQTFIHRDLKPSNILLGDDMRAKVADFGLVKKTPDGKHSVQTLVAGTFGYLAPEYVATGRVSTKADVYAFGVVLMELITGRKALDETIPDDKRHLVTCFRQVMTSRENMINAIDQTLDTNDEETLESILTVAELAGHCTASDSLQRPDMGHVVNKLVPLVEQWKPFQQLQDGEGPSSLFDDPFDPTQPSSSGVAGTSGTTDDDPFDPTQPSSSGVAGTSGTTDDR